MPAESFVEHRVSASSWGVAKQDLLLVLRQAFARASEEAHRARVVKSGPLPRIEVALELQQRGWPAWSRPPRSCDVNRPDAGWPAFRRLVSRELDDMPMPYRGYLVVRLGVEDVAGHAEVVIDCVVANAFDDAVAHRPLRHELMMERRYRRLLERVVRVQTEAMTDIFGASSSVIYACSDAISAGAHLRTPEPQRPAPGEGFVEQAADAISRLVLAYRGDGNGGASGPGAGAQGGPSAASDLPESPPGDTAHGDQGDAVPPGVDPADAAPSERQAAAQLDWIETRTWSAVAKVGDAIHEVILVRHPGAYALIAQLGGVAQQLDTMPVEPSRQYARDPLVREWVRDVLEERLLDRTGEFDAWEGLFDDSRLELDLEWRPESIYAWRAPVRSEAVPKQFTAQLQWLPGRWRVWVDRDRPTPVPPATHPGQRTPPRNIPQQVLAWALEEVTKRGVVPV